MPPPCGLCQRPNCPQCNLYLTRKDYRDYWDKKHPGETSKPRLSVEELARKRARCAKAKQMGLPCTEFNTPEAKEAEMAGTPCKHAEFVQGCAHCMLSADPGPIGRKYRQRFGIPEPVGSKPSPQFFLGERKVPSVKVVDSGGNGVSSSDTPNSVNNPEKVQWVYGVTSVFDRLGDLLPRTLASLAGAGFDDPWLFLDGVREQDVPEGLKRYQRIHRFPRVRAYGNWFLALAELYLRFPQADRFALFQDDFVTYRNLRSYLTRTPFPNKGYLNLYTFPSNQQLCPTEAGKPIVGWYPSNQLGRGAVGLVFDRQGVMTLLPHVHMINRAQDPKRGWKAIDGGVLEAMKQAGMTEYVHNPSLIQHLGDQSSVGNMPHLKAVSFQGEDFDATSLISM